jgi:hypothetical protein
MGGICSSHGGGGHKHRKKLKSEVIEVASSSFHQTTTTTTTTTTVITYTSKINLHHDNAEFNSADEITNGGLHTDVSLNNKRYIFSVIPSDDTVCFILTDLEKDMYMCNMTIVEFIMCNVCN